MQYWFSTASPWAYLGSARFAELVRVLGVKVDVLPIDLGEVFAATGGLPFSQRSMARQSYRQLELSRWSERLSVPLTLVPRFYPVERGPSSKMLIAGREAGRDVLPLASAILRAIWLDDLNIADEATLRDIADAEGLDGKSLLEAARRPEVHQRYLADTRRAIAEEIFGSPTYVVHGERYWGQDRLELLALRLERNRGAGASTRR